MIIGAGAVGDLAIGEALAAPLPPAISLPTLGLSNAERAGRRIMAVEIDAGSLTPSAPAVTALEAAMAIGQVAIAEDAIGGGGIYAGGQAVITLRAGDYGYVAQVSEQDAAFLASEAEISLMTEDGGPLELQQPQLAHRVRPYRPTLIGGVTAERQLPLAPSGSGAGASWGEVRLANADGRYSPFVATHSAIGRRVTLRWGYQSHDAARGLYIDPPMAETAVLWSGFARDWSLGETTLDVALRDAGYWLEQPYQAQLYGGTGGLDGPSSLNGRPKPRLRGGSGISPVRHISPLLVDPAARIYQISDARAVITALYEGGDAANITFQADVSDLYAGTTTAGQFRTDSARGMLQLGRAPARPITVDAYGLFPTLGVVNTPARMAYAMLVDDIGLAPNLVDYDSFAALDRLWTQVAGWHWAEPMTGWQAVGWLLRSCGAVLMPRRDGRLAAVSFLDVGTPRARYSDADIVAVRPVPLPQDLTPPPLRWRIGYERCHTLLTSDIDPDVTEMARQFLASADRFASWFSSAVAAAYTRPTDPEPVATAHLTHAGAQALANALGGCWGRLRRLYDLTLPVAMAARHELGDTIIVAVNMHDLAVGRSGVIVGESLRAGEPTATLRVLI